MCIMNHMAQFKFLPVAILAAQIEATSLRQTAKKYGISSAYLSDIMLGKKAPGPKVLRALGIKRTVQKTVTYSYQ